MVEAEVDESSVDRVESDGVAVGGTCEDNLVFRFEADLDAIKQAFSVGFATASTEQELRAGNARLLGSNGSLTTLLKSIPQLPPNRRRELGRKANALKAQVVALFEKRLVEISRTSRNAEMNAQHLDVTLPGRFGASGRLHPITRVKHELVDLFSSLGFDAADGPDIERYEYNFDMLGFPEDHPATDMQDSFFIRSATGEPIREALLRTHTSTVQIREMLRRKPPLAIVSPGAVYRRDDDATHSPMFFQIEGLLVDTGVSFADLKGILTIFLKRFFGSEVPVRFRPSYFPFVEPGGEVDIGCVFCRPWEDPTRLDSCPVCKGTGWMEVLGCGMVHPVVFESVGYDPEAVSGFAFGMGLDRMAMLKYGIPNIRLLYENDVRFLARF
ncbi:MAG: phenylalanine--tRNA ligase subunit alpha [Myxococcota bacterium]